MSKRKHNWPVTIGVGLALGLGTLVVLKQATRTGTDRQNYKVMIDLKLIKSSVEQYKNAHGAYPIQQKGYLVNFAEQLSAILPSPDVKESRAMFIDYNEFSLGLSNPNYGAPNADSTILLDPWGEPYLYRINGQEFTIWSSGVDKVNSNTDGDDISINAVDEEAYLDKLRAERAAEK